VRIAASGLIPEIGDVERNTAIRRIRFSSLLKSL
jgi:hypothetical protein